jgi:hypothetical protein
VAASFSIKIGGPDRRRQQFVERSVGAVGVIARVARTSDMDFRDEVMVSGIPSILRWIYIVSEASFSA